jgi:hypothetical protein
MAFQKTITLPSRVTLSYFLLVQIDLPVWHKETSWTKGRAVFDRYVSREDFLAGAPRFDFVIYDIEGTEFLRMDFHSRDSLLQTGYSLFQGLIPDFGDADIVDTASNKDGSDYGAI